MKSHGKLNFVAVIVFVLGFGFCPQAFANSDAGVREQVNEIIQANLGQIGGGAETVRLAFELRSLFSQSSSARRIALEVLQAQIPRATPANSTMPSYIKSRAVSAFWLLNQLHYDWSSSTAFESLFQLLSIGINTQAIWDNIVRVVHTHPPRTERVFRALKDPQIIDLNGSAQIESNLIFAINRHAPSVEMLNRHWGPHFMAHRWAHPLYGTVCLLRNYIGRADEVGWIRDLLLRGIRTGGIERYGIVAYLRSNGGHAIHPEILEAISSSQEFAVSLEIATRDLNLKRIIQETTTSNPDLVSKSVLTALPKNPSTDLYNAVAKVVLPTLSLSGNANYAEEILRFILNHYKLQAKPLPADVQQFVLSELVRSILRTGPPHQIRQDLLLTCVMLFDKTNGAGFSDPQAQAAILSTHGARHYDQFRPAYDLLMGIFLSTVPVADYSPETRAFLRSRLKEANTFPFEEAIRRLSHFDRELRKEIIAPMLAGSGFYNSEFIEEFYNAIPEVRSLYNSGILGLRIGSLKSWVRKHGIPDASFTHTYFERFNKSLTDRTADPLMLLAGPNPQRYMEPKAPPVEILPTGDLHLRLGTIMTGDEFELLTLENKQPIIQSPGLPSVTMFFDQQTDQTAVEEKVYGIINEAESHAGAYRIQSIRNGHAKRTARLDAETESLADSFILDPIPSLTQSYSELQEKLRNRSNSNSGATQNRGQVPERALPSLTLGERSAIEASARAEILAVISQTHPLTEILFPPRSTAPYGESPRILSEETNHEALGLALPLRDILPTMPEHIERRSVVLSPERMLSQPPYAQQYHRLVNQMTDDARQRKAQNLLQPPEVEIPLWRERQMNLLRANLRRALETVIREGRGDLVYISEAATPPAGFETTGYFQGKAIHAINGSNLEQIELGWDTLSNEPTLILDGRPAKLASLQYLPNIPAEMNPDAVSVYLMTEPAEGRWHATFAEKKMVRETLFRRSLPLLLRYYAEGMRALNQNITPADDLQFQLNHFATQHRNSRSIRWIPEGVAKHAIAIEALLWNRDIDSIQKQEADARATGQPATNIFDKYADLAGPNVQTQNGKAAPSSENSEPGAVVKRPGSDSSTPQTQPAVNGSATNSIPSEHILHHVSYRGYFPRAQMPEHFLLGERSDFRNASETHVIEVSEPPRRTALSILLRGINKNYPALVNVRSQVPWDGGPSAAEALLPRPENTEIAHIEVTNLQGHRLVAGSDYDVLLHEPTGEYAVRLRPEREVDISKFHVNAFYKHVTPEVLAATRVDPAPEYEIGRLRPVVERARAAGFTNMANKLNQLMQKHEAQNQRTVSGLEIETAVEESAFYSYRDENTFPGAPPNAEVNEFTGWAKFIAEDGTVCAQCDASNGIHATSLASYHEGNRKVRVEARAEYFTEVGAKELRLSDLHLRVHELHVAESGPLRRVIYDVTPSRSDPRSKHARFFQQLRTEVKRQAIGVQSHFIEWWRRTKNVIARATQFMKQRRLVSGRRLTGAPERRSELSEPALNQIGSQTLNDESPIQPLPSEITDPSATAVTTSPQASAPAPEERTAPQNPLAEAESRTPANRETIAREMPQLRRVIQNLGGHTSLDPREGIVLAERVARTYQRLTEGDLTLSEAAEHLNSISPNLHLAADATATQVRDGFSTAANEVMARIQTARRMESAFPHYRGVQGDHIQNVLENLLSPFGVEVGRSQSPSSTNPVECIVESLQSRE